VSRDWPTRILLAFGLLWAGLLGWTQYETISADALWLGIPLQWSKAVPPLLAFGVFFATAIIDLKGRVIGLHAALLSAVLIYYVLWVGEPAALTWRFLGFGAGAWLLGEAGCWLLARLKFAKAPLWAGFLFGAALHQYLLFGLALIGLLNAWTCALTLLPVAAVGGAELWRRLRGISSQALMDWDLRRGEGALIFGIVMVLLYSYIAGSLPQTYTDGLVYRLPYLHELWRSGAIPEHHDLWVWVIPQPGIMEMVPGYFAFGEIGAAWTVLAMFVALGGVVYSFALELGRSRAFALLAALLVLSLPPAWVFSTAIYTDIQISAYTLGGLALVVRALRRDPAEPSREMGSRCEHSGNRLVRSGGELVAGAALLGFAASIKVNAPIVIVCALSLLLLSSWAAWRTLFSRAGGAAIAVGLLFVAPWYLWTFYQTGNPFFPFLNELFPTKLETATIFTDEARSSFAFEPSFLSYLRLPWDLSFSTGRFGSFLNGSFGPFGLLFGGLLSLGLLGGVVTRRGDVRGACSSVFPSVALLLAPALAFFLTSAFLGIAVFRYSLAGYMLAVVAAAGIAGSAGLRLPSWLGMLFAPLAVLFLVLVGSRINYLVDGGVGDEVYRGKVARAEFIERHTHGIPEFVNERIEPGETLFCSMFFFVNRFEAHAYHISSEATLFGKVATLEMVRDYIEEHRVRFWVMNTATPPEHLVEQGLFESLLTEDRVVYGAANYAVYDLRAPVEPLRTLELETGDWRQQAAKSQDALRVRAAPETHAYRMFDLNEGERFLRGKLGLEVVEETATVLLDMIFRGADGLADR
jgi:hypothetical protein